MPNIAEIDPNFKNETKFDVEDAVFYNIKENDWCLSGSARGENDHSRNT